MSAHPRTKKCDCPPGCVYCAGTGECTCPQDHAPYSSIDENPTQKFKRFCEENEGAVECRIYED